MASIALGLSLRGKKVTRELNKLVTAIDTGNHLGNQKKAAESHSPGQRAFTVIIGINRVLHAHAFVEVALSCSFRQPHCTLAGKRQGRHLWVLSILHSCRRQPWLMWVKDRKR